MRSLFETIAHLFHPRRSNNHRPGVLHSEFIVFFLFMAGVFSFVVYKTPLLSHPEYGSILGFASDITTDQVVAQTNQKRLSQGLPELSANAQLNQAAMGKAQDMFAHQYWAHVSPAGVQPWAFISGAGYSYQWAGENLARDFATTSDMMEGWMNSPSHRDNILNGKYTDIGVAVINGVLEGQETTLVVQMFGAPRVISDPQGVVPQAQAQNQPEFVAVINSSPLQENDTLVIEKIESSQPVTETKQLVAELEQPVAAASPDVQAIYAVPGGTVTDSLVSPTKLLRSFFLGLLLLLMVVLVYDFLMITNLRTARLVGKNVAHLMLFMTVAFLLLVFKTGAVI